jgi:hypothetical protein
VVGYNEPCHTIQPVTPTNEFFTSNLSHTYKGNIGYTSKNQRKMHPLSREEIRMGCKKKIVSGVTKAKRSCVCVCVRERERETEISVAARQLDSFDCIKSENSKYEPSSFHHLFLIQTMMLSLHHRFTGKRYLG